MAAKRHKNPRKEEKPNPKKQRFKAGSDLVSAHPIFESLWGHRHLTIREDGQGYATVFQNGGIHCFINAPLEPKAWARVIAHCLLHLGMGHFDPLRFKLLDPEPVAWNHACDLVVERFLDDIHFGLRPPPDWEKPDFIPPLLALSGDEAQVYAYLVHEGAEKGAGFGTAGLGRRDMIFADDREAKAYYRWYQPPDWTAVFAAGLERAVRNAVDRAGGVAVENNDQDHERSLAEQAKAWFISSYPLLGALASTFKIIDDPKLCGRMEIHTAAVAVHLQELYLNPAAGLTTLEYRFVMAHELLHAGLRHDLRHQWRDPYLWNVACDYVVNQWLIEMQVGDPPLGILLDMQFKGLSAEAVYDRITTDIRRFRKLATLRGIGLGDMLPSTDSGKCNVDLDEFYRRSLGQGLTYHEDQGRGYLPEGLVEEIRALMHPPIPWDVELARWFDEHFIPLEKTRSYARPSRRQSSTPDIPRPNWIVSRQALDDRTFGVVLDTSGSMPRGLLASA
ncbi:MAG: hypothetical protein LBL76_09045, partial [Treponema sp.]|nr:hypothetical protein [Treponema sp.]